MAVFKPELHRLEDVLDYYENSPATHYKIFAGTSPKVEYCRFYFDEDEKEIGLQKLLSNNFSLFQKKGMR